MNNLIEKNKQAAFEKHKKMEDALKSYRKLFFFNV